MIEWKKLPDTSDIRWLGGKITHEKRFTRIEGRTFYREILTNEAGVETVYYDCEKHRYSLNDLEKMKKNEQST